MTDLFESMQEHHAERLAIMHKCEVMAVMRQCYPDGGKAKEYFAKVKKERGHLAEQRLRDDVREEWKKRRGM